MKQTDTSRELAHLILAVAGVLAVERLWTIYVRPWLGRYVHLDAAGQRPVLTLGSLHWTAADLIGIGVLVILGLVLVGVIRSALRRGELRRAHPRPRRSTAPGAGRARQFEDDDEEW